MAAPTREENPCQLGAVYTLPFSDFVTCLPAIRAKADFTPGIVQRPSLDPTRKCSMTPTSYASTCGSGRPR
jgi:hypothetical protein